jgi:hypothetical protein
LMPGWHTACEAEILIVPSKTSGERLEIGEKLPVFISWADERSKAVALALRSWIPMILQNTDPWMSAVDISSGERWSPAIAQRLSASRFGILCLTPENATRPWVLFEAGAVAKAIELDARVCPYLFGFSKPTDVPAGPLSQFQAKLANEKETFELIADLNAALGTAGIQPDHLPRLFTALWPQLDAELQKIPSAPPGVPRTRSIDDIVPEILDTVRLIERRLPPAPDPPVPSARIDDPLRYRYAIRGILTPDLAHDLIGNLRHRFGDKLVSTVVLQVNGRVEGVQFELVDRPLSRGAAKRLLALMPVGGLSLYNDDRVKIATTEIAGQAT